MGRALRSVGKVVAIICLMHSGTSSSQGTLLLAQTASAHWTPFKGRFVQDQYADAPGGPYRFTVEGVYVRNSQGASYNRRTASTRSALPLKGAIDIAFLHDRPNQFTYVIDFVNKTIKQQIDPVDNPDFDFALAPPSREDFDKRHAGDLFIGSQTISGVECEGYKLADPRHKGKYRGEEWFAPSLNFMMVQYHGRLAGGGETTAVLKDLEPGKEPDPSYFILPASFRRVK